MGPAPPREARSAATGSRRRCGHHEPAWRRRPSNLNVGLAKAKGDDRVSGRRSDPHRAALRADLRRGCSVDVPRSRSSAARRSPSRATDSATAVGIARALNNRWSMGGSRYRRVNDQRRVRHRVPRCVPPRPAARRRRLGRGAGVQPGLRPQPADVHPGPRVVRRLAPLVGTCRGATCGSSGGSIGGSVGPRCGTGDTRRPRPQARQWVLLVAPPAVVAGGGLWLLVAPPRLPRSSGAWPSPGHSLSRPLGSPVRPHV